MVNKITNENIDQINIGDIIYRYPKNGEPTTTFDRANRDELTTFYVSGMQPYREQFDFSFNASSGVIGMMTAIMGPLSKRREEIVRENRWWHEPFFYFIIGYNISFDGVIVGNGTHITGSIDIKQDNRVETIEQLNIDLRRMYGNNASVSFVSSTRIPGTEGIRYNNHHIIERDNTTD